MRIDRQDVSARVLAGIFALCVVLGSWLTAPASAYTLINVGNHYTAWIGDDIPVQWSLNTTLNDPTITNEFEILRGSWGRWGDRVANLDLDFVEGPTTTLCGLAQNGVNHISMQDCFNQCTGSCLAVTSTIAYSLDGWWNVNTAPSDSLLVSRQESDITWSKTVNWEDYRAWPPCPSGGFDLWGVSIHEMGHFIGLGHAVNVFATMAPSIAPCDSTKASLHADDKRGARALYKNGIRVAAATLDASNASLTVTNKGNVAFTGAGGKIGDSFQWGGTADAQHIFEASLAIARVAGPVSDNFREEQAEADPGGDADFEQTGPLSVNVPGDVVEQEASSTFDDSRAESPYGVEVTSNFYADDSAGNEDFVICEYLIENTTGATLNNIRAGLFADTDFNNDYANNSVNYDATRSLAYVTTPNTGAALGIAVLNEEGAVAMRALFATDPAPAEDFTDANKQAWMSGAFGRTSLGPADVALMIATGNFTIPAGEKINVAFAILGGSNLADLQANTDAARTLYQDVIKNDPAGIEDGHAVLPVALGPASPNPFQGSTRLDYTLYGAGRVQIDVLDASGRIVRTLVDAVQEKGPHSMAWDGTDANGTRLPSGVYFTRMLNEGRETTRKMQLIR